MTNNSNGYRRPTWQRVMDIQLRLKNVRLNEAELDSLHAELHDTLAQFRTAYAQQVLSGARVSRPDAR